MSFHGALTNEKCAIIITYVLFHFLMSEVCEKKKIKCNQINTRLLQSVKETHVKRE